MCLISFDNLEIKRNSVGDNMKILNLNLVASSGIAMGAAFIPTELDLTPAKHLITHPEVDTETSAFMDARDLAISQMQKMVENAPAQRDILTAHIEIAKDGSLLQGVLDKIRNDHKNAQMSLKEVEDSLAARFEVLEDPYLRERAADVHDICSRIMANLKGIPLKMYDNMEGDTIIVARELFPSDTSQMDFSMVRGFVTELGGATSHTCIIARNVGIPAAVGQAEILKEINHGDQLIFDGEKSLLLVNPTQHKITFYKNKMAKHLKRKESLKKDMHLPTVTTDDHKVEVWANVGSINDIESAMENGADGVGLFRTEFLYMENTAFPSEEEQYEIYKKGAELCQGKPLVIRTLDIGGDKSLPYYVFPVEENPFLGWRAIRMTLSNEQEDVFKAQLRALLRASAHGNIHIMYPLVISLEEFRKATVILNKCKMELEAEGLAYNKSIPTGIMIETPASVILAEDFAKEVDFFSIGTNDLTQYVLAVDRGNDKIAALYDTYHPAVLRSIQKVIEAGHKYGKHVGMCGEFAADQMATQILLGMGLDEFSISPVDVPLIKHSIREMSLKDAQNLATNALNFGTTKEVRDFLKEEGQAKL